MREPAFWWREAGLSAGMLAPLGLIYGAIAARRMATKGVSAGLPVVCVGNFTLGGAGKTPTVIMLAQMLYGRRRASVLPHPRVWRETLQVQRASMLTTKLPHKLVTKRFRSRSLPRLSWRGTVSPVQHLRAHKVRALSSWTTDCRIRRC